MLSIYVKAKDALHRLHTREEGQDAFEYLMVVGGVSVAVVAAIILAPGGLIDPVIDAVVAAISGIIDQTPLVP